MLCNVPCAMLHTDRDGCEQSRDCVTDRLFYAQVTAETPVSNEALVVALSAGGALVVLVALMASWTVALKYTVNKRVAAAVARN